MKGNWLSGTLSRVGQPSVLFDAKPEEQTAINREGTYCIKSGVTDLEIEVQRSRVLEIRGDFPWFNLRFVGAGLER